MFKSNVIICDKPYLLKTNFSGYIKYEIKDCVMLLYMNTLVGGMISSRFEILHSDMVIENEDQIKYINNVIKELI